MQLVLNRTLNKWSMNIVHHPCQMNMKKSQDDIVQMSENISMNETQNETQNQNEIV